MKRVKNIHPDICLEITQLAMLNYSTSDLHVVVRSLLPVVKPQHPCFPPENKK